MATNASPDNSARPTKDTPSCPERDGRKTAQDDGSTESDKEPPNEPPHGHISHGSARFLLWIGQRRDREDGFDPEITELAGLYQDWQADHTQTDLSGWDNE